MWGGGGNWQREHKTLAFQERNDPVKLDTHRHRYPYAIVWTPIPPITWFLPFVGHMGVCDSRGVILDFTGAIGVDDLAFGRPTRYIVLCPKYIRRKEAVSMLSLDRVGDGSGNEMPMDRRGSEEAGEPDDCDAAQDVMEDAEAWDLAVLTASKMFENRLHCMICGNDCHSHVAVALNLMHYRGFCWWNKVILAAWVFFCGKHRSWVAVCQTWAGFVVVCCLYLISRLVAGAEPSELG